MLLLLLRSTVEFWDFLEILQRLDVKCVRQWKVIEGTLECLSKLILTLNQKKGNKKKDMRKRTWGAPTSSWSWLESQPTTPPTWVEMLSWFHISILYTNTDTNTDMKTDTNWETNTSLKTYTNTVWDVPGQGREGVQQLQLLQAWDESLPVRALP